MFSFFPFCYTLKSLYIGLALVISYNYCCIHWKVLSVLWAQHSVWRIWRRDRKPTTWSSRSLSSLWSGSGCILGWFHSPADIEAPTTIPPLHTNSSTQAVLARCPRPTTHSLLWHCLPRAYLLHRMHVTDWLSSPRHTLLCPSIPLKSGSAPDLCWPKRWSKSYMCRIRRELSQSISLCPGPRQWLVYSPRFS